MLETPQEQFLAYLSLIWSDLDDLDFRSELVAECENLERRAGLTEDDLDRIAGALRSEKTFLLDALAINSSRELSALFQLHLVL